MIVLAKSYISLMASRSSGPETGICNTAIISSTNDFIFYSMQMLWTKTMQKEILVMKAWARTQNNFMVYGPNPTTESSSREQPRSKILVKK